MIQIYKSNKRTEILYYQLIGIVTLNDAINLGSHIRKHYSNLTNVVSVMDISDDAVLSHKAFLTEIAKINMVYKDVFSRTHVVGLTGIRKLFLKTYRLLTPTNPIEIVIDDNLKGVEKKLNVCFKTDFEFC